MTAGRPRLQAGGTLNPRRHVYVRRPQDERLLALLLAGEYVNVLTSRQMGKSSLMVRTAFELEARRVRTVIVDLAGALGGSPDAEAYYLGLIGQIARSLRIALEVGDWWRAHGDETFNQRLLRFFREPVAAAVADPLVLFLDEIDSTLKHPFTDDLFTAIRGMYNERGLEPAYERICFCLLGVATPNELIKERRTTPYNVGQTLELDDFDPAAEDLAPIAGALSDDPAIARRLLARILYWTGGQPYLTVKLCVDLSDSSASSEAEVDRYVEETYGRLERAGADVHFQQIRGFVADRLSDDLAVLDLYTRILAGRREPDRTTLTHAQLKLSGLVKRDGEGLLVVRNRIYRRLFDARWVAASRPRRALARYRRWAIAASVLVVLLIGGMGPFLWWANDHGYPPGLAAQGLLTRIGVWPAVEPEMVLVSDPPFTLRFQMGLESREEPWLGPVHEVEFKRSFLIGRHEVTFAQYDQFAAATGRSPLASDSGWGRDRRPAIGVSWDDATAYARWLARQTSKAYRLPSEAEWEYAARGETTTSYWWGDDIPVDGEAPVAKRDRKVWANCDGCGSEWDGRQTAPVGSFDPNPFGLQDTAGNVYEWVQDCWHDNYDGAPTDGSAWAEKECGRRVLRGGSWSHGPRYLRSADRYWSLPVNRYYGLGFRLAQDPLP